MVSRKDVDPYNNEDWSDLQRYRAGIKGERAPVGQLSPQPWLTKASTQAVIQALQAQGQKVRFVGGCVRDALSGRPVKDIDIATPDTPETVMVLLEQASIRAIPTGLEHGTVTAVCDGDTFEITTLREDVETDGRHAVVQWTSSWMADAARRDLTINALSASPDGAVYDYFDGLQDLAHGRVRFIGRSSDRIREDGLRILRFFRFHGRYGGGWLNRNALASCRKLAPMLADLSGERIAKEIIQILMAPTATEMMIEMQGVRVLEVILPALKDMGRLRQLVFLETRGLRMDGLAVDPMRRLGAMLTSAEDAQATASRLKLSNAQRVKLLGMLQVDLPAVGGSLAAVRRAAYLGGNEACADALLLRWAGERSLEARVCPDRTHWYVTALEIAFQWQPPEFPVKGRDLLSFGLKPGPALGKALALGKGYWIEQDFQPDQRNIIDHILFHSKTSESNL